MVKMCLLLILVLSSSGVEESGDDLAVVDYSRPVDPPSAPGGGTSPGPPHSSSPGPPHSPRPEYLQDVLQWARVSTLLF